MGKESLKNLNPDFKTSIDQLILNCKTAGYNLIPYRGVRSNQEQAIFWRQSRSGYEVQKAINLLKSNKALFLAKVLKDVGPQHGCWATNALPGQSWHNHGLAIDCFVEVDGKAVWNTDHPGYECYAKEAKNLGLTAGYFWKSRDAVHVQQSDEKVLDCCNWAQLDKIFEEKAIESLVL